MKKQKWPVGQRVETRNGKFQGIVTEAVTILWWKVLWDDTTTGESDDISPHDVCIVPTVKIV